MLKLMFSKVNADIIFFESNFMILKHYYVKDTSLSRNMGPGGTLHWVEGITDGINYTV